MIVLIEGPDGAGKTTLCNELMRLDKFYYIHLNKVDNIEDFYKKFIKDIKRFKKHNLNLIIDRAYISNIIYSKVYGGEALKESTILKIKKYIDKTIVCLPSNKQKYLEEFEKLKKVRKEEYNSMEEIYVGFSNYLKDNKDVFVHDRLKTEIKDLKEILKKEVLLK